jgi:asparagine synthase (glutamine-hydrolysing)
VRLREIIAQSISDDEFAERARKYGMGFLNKEHLFFYEIYRRVVGAVPAPKKNEKACGVCGAGIALARKHCRVCGNVC